MNNLDPNIDPRIKEQGLPNVLALKDGLQGNPASNPEIYLREFLNASSYFRKKSNGEEYKAPASEAHGENDAITTAYEIDFKTLISSSMAQGKRNTSWQKVEPMSGVVFTTEPRKPGETYLVTYLTKLLRGYSVEDLENRTYSKEDPKIVADIDAFMKVVQKDKNLLFFMPSQFWIKGIEETEDATSILAEALNYDSAAFLKYRSKLRSDRDTFISTIYGDKDEFVIWKWGDEKLNFIEAIPLSKSKTFIYLAQYA